MRHVPDGCRACAADAEGCSNQAGRRRVYVSLCMAAGALTSPKIAFLWASPSRRSPSTSGGAMPIKPSGARIGGLANTQSLTAFDEVANGVSFRFSVVGALSAIAGAAVGRAKGARAPRTRQRAGLFARFSGKQENTEEEGKQEHGKAEKHGGNEGTEQEGVAFENVEASGQLDENRDERSGGVGDPTSEVVDGDDTLSEKAKAAIEKLEEQIQAITQLKQEKQHSHDRLILEVNNFRERTSRELAQARGKAAIPIINMLMPVADEFELAKQTLKAETGGERAIASRFEDLFAAMIAVWKELGVSRVESLGQEFNPKLHEAVIMTPSADYQDGVVCSELRCGWVMQAPGFDEPEVLRPSLVCVSSGPGPA
eukprot:TRINITY_DN19028_c0_g1_i1.p1 TRINITY_DN19028_c0_g1~~TRINITY_DN19028_c0_g1_i1.p1  ORF type:complete len:370 (-),score=63.01 TRINITY_DN19028_c0_g1_i1:74-1183(-)